jgi:hypothetical protein
MIAGDSAQCAFPWTIQTTVPKTKKIMKKRKRFVIKKRKMYIKKKKPYF